MKIFKNTAGFIMILAIIGLSACNQMQTSTSSSSDVTLSSELDSVSYAIGIDIGNNLKKSGFDEINPNAIAKGFADVYDSAADIWEAQAANAYVMNYFKKVADRKAEANLKAAEDFLAANKEKEGVVTTESGLQYKIIKEGTGPKPLATDKVKVYYKGTLMDGTVFDETKDDNPAQFTVNGVIKGWIEALQLMPVGSKWELYIHPDLAYGANPRKGGPIQPNDMLIFEIELLEIVK